VSAGSHTDCTLLLIDDEQPNLELLEEFLAPEGFRSLVRTNDAREALPLFERHAPDLVLLDLHMPHVSGFTLLEQIRRLTGPDEFLPVLVLTADVSRATRTRALAAGAHDFLTKPLDALEVRLRVSNLLTARLLHVAQRRAREAAEAATAARELLLSVVAHELRNPLASITMDAEMLRHLLADDEHAAPARAARRIERTAQRMHRLIQDLLDVARLERASFAVRLDRVAPDAVLADAEAMLQPLARRRGVALHFDGPAGTPAIAGDAERLVQVLSNVVGNALDFTPAGGVVRVDWCVAGPELVITVRDSGIGMDAEQLARVFDPFWQGRAGDRRGLGLGLLIARAILEAHGGSIGIDSEPGRGTTVVLSMPVTAPAPLFPVPGPAPTSAPAPVR
jgi:signal transduction histidine kinase